MSRRPRRNHSARVSSRRWLLQAQCASDRTLSELASQCDRAPEPDSREGKTQLLDGRAAQLFGSGTGQAEKPVDMKVLHAKIGELCVVENDFLAGCAHEGGIAGRLKKGDDRPLITELPARPPGKGSGASAAGASTTGHGRWAKPVSG